MSIWNTVWGPLGLSPLLPPVRLKNFRLLVSWKKYRGATFGTNYGQCIWLLRSEDVCGIATTNPHLVVVPQLLRAPISFCSNFFWLSTHRCFIAYIVRQILLHALVVTQKLWSPDREDSHGFFVIVHQCFVQ